MFEYKKLPQTETTFACINSGKGFINYFEEIFAKVNKRYIIKGGPGTGKSSLMRALAVEGERRGIGILPILCSSDPTSLDGLLFPSLGIAVADGTAPHGMEVNLPGAGEQLVDLGVFWDESNLSSKKEEIAALVTDKASGYDRTFNFFAAANAIESAMHNRLSKYIDRQKAERIAARTVERVLPLVPSGKTHHFPQKALSMAGAVELSCMERKAKKVFSVEPFYGAERIFMEMLAEKTTHLSRVLSPDPITLSPDSIFFPATEVLFRISKDQGEKCERTFSVSRFTALPKSERSVIRNYRKASADAVKCGLGEMSALSEKHFALERIYGEAMDFSGIENIKKQLIAKIFG